jgi:hypothetical protein
MGGFPRTRSGSRRHGYGHNLSTFTSNILRILSVLQIVSSHGAVSPGYAASTSFDVRSSGSHRTYYNSWGMTTATVNKTPATPAFTVDAALAGESVLVRDPALVVDVALLLMIGSWTKISNSLHDSMNAEQNNVKSVSGMERGRGEKYELSIVSCKSF